MHRLAHFFGRRGGVLFLFGLAWLILGLNIIVNPSQRFSQDISPPEGGFLDTLDSPLFGFIWIIGGAVAIGNSLIRRRIGNEDAIGYVSLTLPAFVWLSFYSMSYITWVLSGGDIGRSTAAAGVPIYAIIATVLLMIAGWRDPSDTRVVSSKELALLDQFDETHDENKARGASAREASEVWIQEARRLSEESILRSAEENDRRLKTERDNL